MSLKDTKYREVVINGRELRFKKLGAWSGLQVGAKLSEILAPMIGTTFDAWRREGEVLVEDSTIASEITLELSKVLSNTEVFDSIKILLADVKEGNGKVNLEEDLEIAELLILIEAAIKENFGQSFLDYCEAKGLPILTVWQEMREKMKGMLQKDSTTETSQS